MVESVKHGRDVQKPGQNVLLSLWKANSTPSHGVTSYISFFEDFGLLLDNHIYSRQENELSCLLKDINDLFALGRLDIFKAGLVLEQMMVAIGQKAPNLLSLKENNDFTQSYRNPWELELVKLAWTVAEKASDAFLSEEMDAIYADSLMWKAAPFIPTRPMDRLQFNKMWMPIIEGKCKELNINSSSFKLLRPE